jgi:hypothetical protein
MEESFLKFNNKECSLVKITMNKDSKVEAGKEFTGTFQLQMDSVGLRAKIFHSGSRMLITSDIQAVLETTDNSIIFETTTSVYKLEEKNDTKNIIH